MATSRTSSSAMPKHYSDQFEKLYNQTLLESPQAQIIFQKLNSERKSGNVNPMKPPMTMMSTSLLRATPGSSRMHMLSPAAKAIQQMKMADIQDKAAATNGQNTSKSSTNRISDHQGFHRNKNDRDDLGNRQRQQEYIANDEQLESFHCSDSSSDYSSDLSDDEKQSHVSLNRKDGALSKLLPKQLRSSRNHMKQVDEEVSLKLPRGKATLHGIAHEFQSPKKQGISIPYTSTPVRTTKPKTRTPPYEGLLQSTGHLQRSLTPELKAASLNDLTNRSPSPKTRNTSYRNKRVDIDESITLPEPCRSDQTEAAPVVTPTTGDFDEFAKDVTGAAGDRRRSSRNNNILAHEAESSKNKPNQAPSETPILETPATGTATGTQQEQTKKDDETPKNSKMSKPKDSNETVLHYWFIQLVANGKGVRLQGHRIGDPPASFWNSSVITERVNNTTLKTKSGSVYKLEGKIEKLRAREEGFTTKVIKQFQNGFPRMWKEILSDSLPKTSSTTRVAKGETVEATPIVRTNKRKHNTTQQPQNNRQDPKRLTPQNTVTINDLPRSCRSGRMIKPPLAYWMNQRVRHNRSIDTVEIMAGGTDYLSITTGATLTGSTELTPDELSRAKRTKLRELKKSSTVKKNKAKRSKGRGTDEETSTDDEKDNYAVSDSQMDMKHKQPDSNKDSEVQSSSDTQTIVERPPEQEDRRHALSSRDQHIVEHQGTEDAALQKEPPVLQRKRSKYKNGRSNNTTSRFPKSPLYYHLSPPSFPVDDTKSSKESEQPLVGDTPSAEPPSATSKTSDSRPLKKVETPGIMLADTPVTFGLKVNALNQAGTAEIILSDVKKKIGKIGKTKMLGSSPLTLQDEVLSVLKTHKERRIAKGQNQQNSRPKNSTLKKSSFSKSSTISSPDVYNLDSSSDDFDKMQKNQENPKTRATIRQQANKPAPVINLITDEDSTDDFTSINPPKRVTRAATSATRTKATSKPKTKRGRPRKKTESETISSAESGIRSRSRTRSSERSRVSNDDTATSTDKDRSNKDTLPRSSERTKLVHLEAATRELPNSKTETPNESCVESDTESSNPKFFPSRKKLVCTRRITKLRARQNVNYTEDNVAVLKPMKRTTSVVDKNEEWKETLTARKKTRNQKKVGKGTGKRNNISNTESGKLKGNGTSNTDSDEKEWSVEELSQLKSAIEVVAPGTPMYWQCIAALVESKSAHLCQLKHQESLEKQMTQPTVRKQQKTKKKNDDDEEIKEEDKKKDEQKDPVKLTAKVGTMKRKRQLRELVEQHNQGHEGDYFDSTPFKRKTKRFKISANLDSDDEDDETAKPFSGRTPGSARYKTPSTRPRGLEPLSDKKTPHTNLLTPWSGAKVDRNHLDTYISGIQKKKKVRKLVPQTTPSIKKRVAKAKKATNFAIESERVSASGIFDVRPVSEGSDSERESDYYWSDEEH